MAVGRAVPRTIAGDLGSLATSIAAKPAISAAVVVPSLGEVDVLRPHIKVTGTAVKDVRAAIDTNSFNVDHGGSTSGNFTLTVDGVATGNIAYNASAATVKSDLEGLSTVVLATVTGTGTVADPFVVTLDDTGSERTCSGTDVDLAGGSGLTVSTPVDNVQILPGSTIA